MTERLLLGKIAIDVELKDIKNVHLSVYPPSGRVRIAAPRRMSLDTVRVFAISKLDWIRKQRRKIQQQERETPREFVDRESHYLWGERYLLKVVDGQPIELVEVRHRKIVLRLRTSSDATKRRALLEQWYREELRSAAEPLIERWADAIGVSIPRLFVQRMKTRWGSCNRAAGSIRLNTELAKKPRECLEYVIVHELIHLIEAVHNDRFVALMDRFMPLWKAHRDRLSALPLGHEEWRY